MRFLKIGLPFLLYFSRMLCQDEIIQIENGLVRGRKMSNNMYGFRGIPFAKPPINELRFEPPQEPDNWSGVWNATYDRNDCVQVDVSMRFMGLLSPPTGNEDCLYINVYTPQLPNPNDSLPVMVWIYGGLFQFGSSNYSVYSPDYLVQRNVIVVSFDYRLGIFGFISTNDTAAPGNIGLKDQIFALKWVQRNIRAFGGNPQNVTVFGESAGAASISYLVMSPLAQGLFRNAIMESGTALCLWAHAKRTNEAAFLLGINLGILTRNSTELIRRLKNVPAEKLHTVSINVMQSLLLTSNIINGLVYGPVIEPPNENAVISDNRYRILSKGHFNPVPVIIGFNSAEATGFSQIMELFRIYLVSYDLVPARLVPPSMNVKNDQTVIFNEIGRTIKEYYGGLLGSLTFPDGSKFASFLSDDQFVRPIRKTVELMAKHSTIYFYKFSYNTNPNSVGAGHTDELSYIFVSNRTTLLDTVVRNCMVGLWTNFAKYNDPTFPSDICPGNTIWLPVGSQPNENYYLSIDRGITLERKANQEEYMFWENLFTQYGTPPYDTY